MVKRGNEVLHYFSCIPFVKVIRNPYDATFNPFPNMINHHSGNISLVNLHKSNNKWIFLVMKPEKNKYEKIESKTLCIPLKEFDITAFVFLIYPKLNTF